MRTGPKITFLEMKKYFPENFLSIDRDLRKFYEFGVQGPTPTFGQVTP